MNAAARPRSRRLVPRALLAGLLLGGAAASFAQGGCEEVGPVRGDYIGERKLLATVEKYHFPPSVAIAVRPAGQSVSWLGGNLDYTLRSFPNHHRALNALVILWERDQVVQPPGSKLSTDCWFERAVRFRGDDVIVRMLYARYLGLRKQPDRAAVHLAEAERAAEGNVLTLYNAGLVHAELKRWDDALRLEHAARAQGMARVELKDKLVKAGRWREPAPAEAAATATAPPAAAAGAAAEPGAPAGEGARAADPAATAASAPR
jgi:hypothetical protein